MPIQQSLIPLFGEIESPEASKLTQLLMLGTLSLVSLQPYSDSQQT
jgi:hypothetical protein